MAGTFLWVCLPRQWEANGMESELGGGLDPQP